MTVVVRALVYASLFIGVLLVLLPARLLTAAGVERPVAAGPSDVVGMVLAALGAGLALWCILTFATLGRGTPAPFDPPQRLVTRGPYRYIRNPMYLGATLALVGAALVYRSPLLAAYAALFLVACHLFVLLYEEPALRRRFGRAYDEYRRRVPRWSVRGRGSRANDAAS